MLNFNTMLQECNTALEVKRQEVLDELDGAAMRDITPASDATVINFNPKMQLIGDLSGSASLIDEEKTTQDAEPQIVPATARPTFIVDSDRYEWLMQNRGDWISSDRNFLTEFVASDIYRGLSDRFEGLEIAWNGFDQDNFKVAV